MNETKQKKGHWGKGIAILYGGFVLFILAVVIFASFQDFSLVEDNYYNKELLYQEQIDRIKNTANLVEKPLLNIDRINRVFTIVFPDSLYQLGIEGTIHFFRPSDKRHDQIINIDLGESGQMKIPLDRFIKGYWRLKIKWVTSGKEYYLEELLSL